MNLKNKKILVTGGAGFIGSHTVDALIKKGARVVVVDNLSTGRKENLNPAAKFYKLNINSPKIEEIIKKEKPEIIYHFAFYVKVPKSVQDPMLDMDCLIGSIRILKAARELKNFKKFIFASSGFLYKDSKNLSIQEGAPIDPISPYIIAKRAVEDYVGFFKNAFGVPYVVMRYTTTYGPRQTTGAMADYIKKLSQGKQAEIWGDGTKIRDYLYVKDAVRANLKALNIKNDYPNPVFNVSTGIETTLNDLYHKIARLLGKKAKPIYYPDRPSERMRCAPDASKIKEELGWKPTVSLDEGLIKLLKFWHLL